MLRTFLFFILSVSVLAASAQGSAEQQCLRSTYAASPQMIQAALAQAQQRRRLELRAVLIQVQLHGEAPDAERRLTPEERIVLRRQLLEQQREALMRASGAAAVPGVPAAP